MRFWVSFGPVFVSQNPRYDMAGPAELLKTARKPYCDWVMQNDIPVAVGFAGNF